MCVYMYMYMYAEDVGSKNVCREVCPLNANLSVVPALIVSNCH